MAKENTSEDRLHWFDDEFPRPDHANHPNRAKNWTLVCYPDDMADDWLEKLRELKFPIAVSPLHDKDVNPDGDLKKSHYHVIIKGGKSWIYWNDLKKVCKEIRGVAIPQHLSNVEGMVRYFVHADNPEKYQYSASEIQVFGQFDIEKAFKRTDADNDAMSAEIIMYIVQNDVTEFSDLIEYSIAENYEWFRFINSRGWLIEKFISSRRNKAMQILRKEILEKEKYFKELQIRELEDLK